MDDLDKALAKLASAPVPAALDGMEAQVLARIGLKPVARLTGLGVCLVTAAALAIGMVGEEVPAIASPAVSLAPLGGTSPLSLSALLIGEP